MELNPPLRGNRVTVLVEEMEGGNYSCHLSPGGQYLNHTVIYIQLDSEKRIILKERSPEEGRFRETECVLCVFESCGGSKSSSEPPRAHPLLSTQLHQPVSLFLVKSNQQTQRCCGPITGNTVIPSFSFPLSLSGGLMRSI